MRTALLLIALGALASAGELPEPESFAGRVLGPVVPDPRAGEEVDPRPDLESLDALLPPGPAARARGFLAALLAERWTARAAAFSFDRAPPAVAALAGREDPVLTAEDADALRAATRAGEIRLERTVSASGGLGEEILAGGGGEQSVACAFDGDGAIGAVLTLPVPAVARSGLALSARILPAAGSRADVSFEVSFADAPVRTERDSTAGRFDCLRLGLLHAGGRVRLAAGETAAVVRIGPGGAGRLVLFGIDGPGRPIPVLTDLGDGFWALPAAHLEPWDGIADAAGFSPSAFAPGPLSFRTGEAEPAGRTILAGLVGATSREGGRRFALRVREADGSRISVPLSPGSGFRFFAGVVTNERTGTGWAAGCNRCVLTYPEIGSATEGLSGEGFVREDGTTDLDLSGRTVLAAEERTYPLRRMLPGYQAYARDAMMLPLVSDRLLSFSGALPAGGGRVGDGLAVDLPLLPAPAPGLPRADLPPAPVRLLVNGFDLPVRPGSTGRLRLLTRRPAVRTWENGGWCGMRVR